jgi:hypothetical protein
VRISGLTLRNQLVSDEPLGAELASIMTWRYAQVDAFANKKVPYMSWKHDLEADFAESLLSAKHTNIVFTWCIPYPFLISLTISLPCRLLC